MNMEVRDAIKVAEAAAKVINDKLLLYATARLKRKLKQKPLRDIIAKVPGDTWKDRAKALGVSRQAMQRWFDGSARPNETQAKRISELTGVSEKIIRG